MKKWIYGSLLTLGLAMSAACGPTGSDSSDSCSSDSECKADRICEDGECVSPGGGGGGDNGGNGGNGGNNSSGNNSSGNNDGNNSGGDAAWCCVNGAYYGCATDADAQTCVFDFDPSVCNRDASRDATCNDDNGGNNDNNSSGNNGNNSSGNNSNGKKATGETCEVNNECDGGACLVRDSGDILGYCSERCDSFADCPTFWDCEELGNAAGKYCVEN